jgi:hypothetical protein
MFNSGGILDTRTADNEPDAARVLVEMVKDAGELHDGDRFEVQEITG